MPTSDPCLWTWIRMPSSFVSTATGTPPPSLAIASATVGALEASIGSTGRPTRSRRRARPSAPPTAAASAAAGTDPANMAARRTNSEGTS